MNNRLPGRILIVAMLATALIAGVSLWWLQTRAYYVELAAPAEPVTLVSITTGEAEEIPWEDFRAIESISAPIGYRSCFTTVMSQATLTEVYQTVPDAVPLNAPAWFACHDARALGAALESGEAIAFLGRRDIVWGFDRVIAVLPDGRAFGWNRINHCGAAVFNGEAAPDDCPPLPERPN
ncbi:MAG: histidine kinase [Rubellimicrobium sp.]|nr:histidine kinase [Rubellimicrobium sp.]